MKVINTNFSGLKIIKLKKHSDSRGSLTETYRKKTLSGKDLIFDYKVSSKKILLEVFISSINLNK